MLAYFFLFLNENNLEGGIAYLWTLLECGFLVCALVAAEDPLTDWSSP